MGSSHEEMAYIAMLSVIQILNKWCYLFPRYGCLECVWQYHPIVQILWVASNTFRVNPGGGHCIS